ncbi:AI-2E family transporter [Herpetosiphon geysericola]|uniref:AI-2E family transporter n=1 Tax=Herpetosiphon geysericola TaxID=70996 RepID=UPI0006C90B79|nr:AI-2E family transporter [Herpetosiphon geysericola]
MEPKAPVPVIKTIPTWRDLARWTLTAFAIWLVLWLLWRTGTQLLPFAFGLMFAYLLLPLVNKLERWLPRWAAILVVYVVGLGLLIGSVLYIVPPAITQVKGFFESLPDFYKNTLEPKINEGLTWYRREVPTDIQTNIDGQVGKGITTLKENASNYVQSGVNGVLNGLGVIFQTLIFLAGFLIIPFWLFYVLLDERKGKAAIIRMIPKSIRTDVLTVLSIFDRVFSSYIRGQLTLGLIIAIMSYIGLWIVDLVVPGEIPYKLLLALVAGFTELIPVIGPIIGAIPAIIVGLTTSLPMGLVIAGLYIVIQQIENNFLVPRIIGAIVEIHEAILMLLLVVAGTVSGLLGVIIFAPMAAVARDSYQYINGRLRQPDDPRYLRAGELPWEHKEEPETPMPPMLAFQNKA